MKERFSERIEEIFEGLLDLIPDLTIAVIIFLTGWLFIRLIKRQIFSRIIQKAKDPVASQFLTEIVTFIFYIILTITSFKFIGLSKLTQTIIGAAGLTTFIIGFALKDIGENFLAGIVMIFDRPFEMGDLIELDGRVGRVIKISIRETTIKTIDGKDVYFPNSDIVKKPFTNYTIDDQLRDTIEIHISSNEDTEEVIKIILEVVNSFQHVLKSKKASVNINSIVGGKTNLAVNFWYSLRGTRTRNGRLKTEIIIAISNKLKEKGIALL